MKLRNIFSDRVFFFILIIVLFQTAIRLFLYSRLFNYSTLYCGDCAAYFFMAFNGQALADRPSGISFVLWVLFSLFPDSDPAVVALLLNSLLGTLTHVLFFLTLRRFSEAGNAVPFCVSMLFFINPVILIIDSMVFMADTLSYFMLSLVLWLILEKTSGDSSIYKNILASLILGYLTIVRSVFVYLAPFIILYMLYKAERRTALKTLSTGALLLIIFSIIPFSYAFFFNKPRLGTASIENFGGISAFSHILPYLSCEKVLSISKSPEEEDAVKEFCNDEEIKYSTVDYERWNPSSSLNLMVGSVVSHYPGAYKKQKYRFQRSKVAANRLLMRWFFRGIWKYPEAAVLAMEDAIYGGYLANPIESAVLAKEKPHIDTGCEKLVSRLYSLDKTTYMDLWQRNKKDNYEMLYLIDRLALVIATATHYFVILALFLLPICFMRRRFFNKDSFFLYVIGLIYLFLFSLGNGYDARFSVVFNYCICLSLGILALTYFGSKDEAVRER